MPRTYGDDPPGPWLRVGYEEGVDYFNAVADPNCTEDEIRELTALVAGERGWELEDE